VNVPLPDQRDLKKALRIYVSGRNRAWTAEEKRSAAGDDVPPAAVASGSSTTGGAEPQVGVPVPDSLQFHRGPIRWRGEIPGGRRGRMRRDHD
jgi:hypothetical protein